MEAAPISASAASADGRLTIALYHHLPPGGADRAMFELTRRTVDEFRYVLFEIELDHRDPFHGADRSPLRDVVDETYTIRARAGGSSQMARWGITVPSVLRAERTIARMINDLRPAAVVGHHQRFTQAPSIFTRVDAPSVYMLQEPRRRSFEYDLARQPIGTAAGVPVAILETWARRHDIAATRSATAILCNSDHSREYVWRAYGRDAEVVRLGVDGERFVLPDQPTGIDTQPSEILAVGSLDSTKGHELTIAAIGLIDCAVRPQLRIVHNRAAPSVSAKLTAQAERLGVHLVLETAIPEDELVARYQQASAVVLAARVEPFGLTALEAMACGTPVVAVREGGYRETVVDGVNGFLTDRSPSSLAAGLTRVLRAELPSTPAQVRQSAVTRFSWEAAAATYAGSIRSVARGPG